MVVLCVDDEPIALTLRTLILEDAGYNVIAASSAAEGIQVLRSEKVDIVVSDYLMPGVSGTKFARQIKANHPAVPVLLISGVDEAPADAQIADRFVSKLIGAADLCKEVAGLLRGKQDGYGCHDEGSFT